MKGTSEILLMSPYSKLSLEVTPTGLKASETEIFPYVNGAYRIVQGENYTDSFGFQWNKFQKTQIDRLSNNSFQSKERFFAVTQWDKEDLSGQNILEVGSGAGRFTEVVLTHTQANLYSVDYSHAVEANHKNNGPHTRLKLFQASIYELPFLPHQFDKVFCFGVLQHTPDFKKSLESLAMMVKPGGQLVVDFYPINGWYTKFHAKYLFRPFTRKLSAEKLLRWIESNIDWMMYASSLFERLGIGKFVNRFIPICDIRNTIPLELSKESKREWVVLDTFDMFSPDFDQPQRLKTVLTWLRELGLTAVTGSTIQYGSGNSVTFAKARR